MTIEYLILQFTDKKNLLEEITQKYVTEEESWFNKKIVQIHKLQQF